LLRQLCDIASLIKFFFVGVVVHHRTPHTDLNELKGESKTCSTEIKFLSTRTTRFVVSLARRCISTKTQKKNPNICEADLIQITHRTAVGTALISTLAAPHRAVKISVIERAQSEI